MLMPHDSYFAPPQSSSSEFSCPSAIFVQRVASLGLGLAMNPPSKTIGQATPLFLGLAAFFAKTLPNRGRQLDILCRPSFTDRMQKGGGGVTVRFRRRTRPGRLWLRPHSNLSPPNLGKSKRPERWGPVHFLITSEAGGRGVRGGEGFKNLPIRPLLPLASGHYIPSPTSPPASSTTEHPSKVPPHGAAHGNENFTSRCGPESSFEVLSLCP